MDGAPLGSVKGGVKDVNMDDRCSSRRFRNSLAVMLILLSRYFTEIGAEDCKEFLLPVLPEMKVKKRKAVQVQRPHWMVYGPNLAAQPNSNKVGLRGRPNTTNF